MSEELQTPANMDIFNRCLICQSEVYKRSFSNLKLCQKFITVASRYYNIHFPDNSLNLCKTLKVNQLKYDSDYAQLVSCDNCSQKINSFCEIYEEVSLLQIHLDASARKITELMKNPNNTNSGRPDSPMLECFRNQFNSRVAQHFPHVKLRGLKRDYVSTFETDPLYIPTEHENSGDDDESDSEIVQLDHHSSTDSFSAVATPPPSNSITEITHQANKVIKISKVVAKGFENLVTDSSSTVAVENNVEILKSLPEGSLLVVPGTTDPERRHKCRFCDKAFKTQQNKINHEKVHLQPYQCRFCNRTFSARSTMRVHERTHTGIKPFKCSVCAETFREKRRCTDHIWRVHKGNAEVIEDLKLEEESNLVEAKIEENLAEVEATPNSQDPERPFKCEICLKGFTKRRNLIQHEKLHTKLFHCDICGARFPNKYVLADHKRTHTGERPFLCPICFQTFSQSQSCKSHQRNVHKILNGVAINTKVYGVQVVRENALPKEDQNVTPGNQSDPEIERTEKLQCSNGNGDNFILPDIKQEVQINLNESGDAIVDTELSDPLGHV